MNVVISTTFGWNIGDQIILAGVKRLLGLAWNPAENLWRMRYVHHDRNPVKLPSGGEESHAAIRSGWADALVIAGSPGWTLECDEVYRAALDMGVPIYLIGIGTGTNGNHLAEQVSEHPNIARALSAAKVVICRDEIARDVAAMHAQSVELLPCPAVANGLWGGIGWASEGRVALGEYYAGPWCMSTGVAHQTSDLERSGGRAFYSSSVADYLAIYMGAQDVVSSRLHASILRLAFGLPVANLWPADEPRCSSTWDVAERGMRAGLDAIVGQYVEILGRKVPNEKNYE